MKSACIIVSGIANVTGSCSTPRLPEEDRRKLPDTLPQPSNNRLLKQNDRIRLVDSVSRFGVAPRSVYAVAPAASTAP